MCACVYHLSGFSPTANGLCLFVCFFSLLSTLKLFFFHSSLNIHYTGHLIMWHYLHLIFVSFWALLDLQCFWCLCIPYEPFQIIIFKNFVGYFMEKANEFNQICRPNVLSAYFSYREKNHLNVFHWHFDAHMELIEVHKMKTNSIINTDQKRFYHFLLLDFFIIIRMKKGGGKNSSNREMRARKINR